MALQPLRRRLQVRFHAKARAVGQLETSIDQGREWFGQRCLQGVLKGVVFKDAGTTPDITYRG